MRNQEVRTSYRNPTMNCYHAFDSHRSGLLGPGRLPQAAHGFDEGLPAPRRLTAFLVALRAGDFEADARVAEILKTIADTIKAGPITYAGGPPGVRQAARPCVRVDRPAPRERVRS